MKNKKIITYVLVSLIAGVVIGVQSYKYTYGQIYAELMAYEEANNLWYEAKYLESLKDGKIEIIKEALTIKVEAGIENKNNILRHISDKNRKKVEEMYSEIEMSSNKSLKNGTREELRAP